MDRKSKYNKEVSCFPPKLISKLNIITTKITTELS